MHTHTSLDTTHTHTHTVGGGGGINVYTYLITLMILTGDRGDFHLKFIIYGLRVVAGYFKIFQLLG